MNRTFIETDQTITRGTSFPLALTLPFDLTGYTITFTMRTFVADNGEPILQCDNNDTTRMNVQGEVVTINLTTADTWKISEKAPKVYIQLNLSKYDDTFATEVYALNVLPNILEQGEQP